MLICFHASAEAKNALEGILATGHFRDISEAISIALVNYGVLTRTVAEGGQMFPAGSNDQPAASWPTTQTAEGCSPPQPKAVGPAAPAARPVIPELFTLKSIALDEITFLEVPQLVAAEATNLPPARWLFGQFNKFLAPKATCRALLNLLLQSPAGIPVAEASNKISYAACMLGAHLQSLDQQIQSKREDAFGAAFPTTATAEGGGESRLRFGNQFVAHIRQNQLGGFPAALRLVTLTPAKDPRLSLTKAGVEFAIIENPVLDAKSTTPTRKLSQAEIEFLLTHILKAVPEETSAFAAILDAIQAGFNTPDTVDKFLRKRFSLLTEKSITKTFLTTQRTGAISRMADLGLLGRQKEGLRVTYFITEQGSALHTQLPSCKNKE